MSFESPRETPRKFLENIQSLRAIATLMIVASHWRSIDSKYSGDPLNLFNYLGFGRFAIDMFFVVSGFIMVYISWTSRDTLKARAKQAGRFLFARTTRIFPIYWIISGAIFVLYLFRPDWVFSSSALSPNIIKSIFLWPDTAPPLLAVAWTLVHELEFYLIFAVMMLIPRGKRLYGLGLWALILTIGQLQGWRNLGPVRNIVFSPFTYDFIAGTFLAYLYQSQKFTIRNTAILWGGFILSFLWAYLAYLYYQPFIYDSLTRVLIYIVPAIVIVYTMCELNRQNQLLPKWLQTIGNWSFVLYLTHVLTLSVLGRLWTFLNAPNSAADNLVMFTIALGLTIMVAGLIYSFIELPIRSVTNRWRKSFLN